MIRVKRGKEPASLKPVRDRQLAALRTLAKNREIVSKDIDGYRVVVDDLWHAQHLKCCYCEGIYQKSHNDVEHFRPKGSANRSPGSPATHGYWWLAFTWSNLLFSCNVCNRMYKKCQFPLDVGSKVANARGNNGEIGLLLDPASPTINPVAHIVHELHNSRWIPLPRDNSVFGSWSIEVFGLNRDELHDLREKHVELVVRPEVAALKRHIQKKDRDGIENEFQRACELFAPAQAHAALSYDALRHFVPDADLLAAIGQTWPQPAEVGI